MVKKVLAYKETPTGNQQMREGHHPRTKIIDGKVFTYWREGVYVR